MATRGLIRGLREQIANQLRDDILAGRFEAGDRLSEISLAERFGVSRGPIREALVQLTHEGLLVGRPNCGVSVAPAAPDSIKELIVPIRRTIETFALRQFFDDINENDFQIWEDILQKLKQAVQKKDVSASAEADIAFHRSLLVRANLPDLLAIWQTIVSRIRVHFHDSHLREKDPMSIYFEHKAIVDTFRTGNRNASVKILEENII